MTPGEVPDEVRYLTAACPDTVRFEGDRLIVSTGSTTAVLTGRA